MLKEEFPFCLFVFKLQRFRPRVSREMVDLAFTEHLSCECR